MVFVFITCLALAKAVMQIDREILVKPSVFKVFVYFSTRVSLCNTQPVMYKCKMEKTCHLSVSEPARQIPHSQRISSGEQGVLPQNERRLL